MIKGGWEGKGVFLEDCERGCGFSGMRKVNGGMMKRGSGVMGDCGNG